MIENCTIYEQRLYRLQEQMITQEIDCAVVCTSPNLFYMTGYAPKKDERFQVAFFPKEGEPVLERLNRPHGIHPGDRGGTRSFQGPNRHR